MVREAVRNAVPTQRKKTERPAVKMAAAVSLIDSILESDRKARANNAIRHGGFMTGYVPRSQDARQPSERFGSM